jgi:hypothetical protein
VLSLIGDLGPKLEKLCTENSFGEEAVIQFLQSKTFVGILPCPHPLFVRKFPYSEQTGLWLNSFFWGILYLRYMAPEPAIWHGTSVKLFQVNITPKQ